MARPKKPGIFPAKIRLATSLVADLRKAAKRNGRSFNAEAAIRLGRSIAEESANGGVEGQQIVQHMAADFFAAGQFAAGPSRPILQWIKDQDCIAAAWLGVAEGL